MNGAEMTHWDRAKLARLKDAYDLEDDPKATMYFEGHALVVGYAKYLIEYLEGQFGERDATRH